VAGQVDPNVIKNETGTDMTSNTGAWVFIPATVYLHMHPGSNGQYTVVRWIARRTESTAGFRVPEPENGWIGHHTDVHVLLNNSPIFNGAINGFYAGGISLCRDPAPEGLRQAGFRGGVRSNQNYLYDSTG